MVNFWKKILGCTSWGGIFSVNGRKLYAEVMWRDYVKSMQNLEKCVIDFFY